MPSAPLKPCAHPACPELVPRTDRHCKAHRVEEYRRQDAARDRDPMYHTARWRKIRKIVLQRDPLCKACGRQPSTVVDHIKPVADGGARWDLSNLRGMDASCHNRKTALEVLHGKRGVLD